MTETVATGADDTPSQPGGVSVALWGLFVLACLYTAYFARDFLLPVVVALMFKFLLDPVIRRLKSWRVPEALGAALVLLAVLAALAYGVRSLAHPAGAWLTDLPATARKLEAKLRPLRRPVQQVTEAGAQVEKITSLGSSGESPTGKPQEQQAPASGPSALSRTGSLLMNVVVTLLLLYFLLASGDLFLRKLIKVLPRLRHRKRAVDIAAQIEADVSAYLVTVTVVNLGFGTAVGLAMAALSMPNPVLWGALAAVTNYLPYLGPLICGGILTAVALLTFDSVPQALFVPIAFFMLHGAESYFVTPFAVGRRLTLNPVAIFLGVSFWGWVWGVPGALLAVPLLAICKIVCDRIEPLTPVGEFLGK